MSQYVSWWKKKSHKKRGAGASVILRNILTFRRDWNIIRMYSSGEIGWFIFYLAWIYSTILFILIYNYLQKVGDSLDFKLNIKYN